MNGLSWGEVCAWLALGVLLFLLAYGAGQLLIIWLSGGI
jgi:hypothetical protein